VPWLLGSSEQSAIWAGQLGLPYAFADFINPRGAEIAAVYRDHFTASTRLELPRLAVAAWAICADTDAEAERLSASGLMAMSLLRQGRLIAVPPVEKALRFLAQQGGGSGGRRRILGSPPQVRAELEELADAYGADEVIVVSIVHDHDARRRSYELIADAFALKPMQLA
jgi:luciferase family oxidoreductase group 1